MLALRRFCHMSRRDACSLITTCRILRCWESTLISWCTPTPFTHDCSRSSFLTFCRLFLLWQWCATAHIIIVVLRIRSFSCALLIYRSLIESLDQWVVLSSPILRPLCSSSISWSFLEAARNHCWQSTDFVIMRRRDACRKLCYTSWQWPELSSISIAHDLSTLVWRFFFSYKHNDALLTLQYSTVKCYLVFFCTMRTSRSLACTLLMM